MGALGNVRKYLKRSIFGIMLGSSFGTIVSMANLTGEVDEYTVDKAIEYTIKNNPEMSEELGRVSEVMKIAEKAAEERENKLGLIESGKDEDGYIKIPNKLENTKTEVSNIEIQQETVRESGGEEKIKE